MSRPPLPIRQRPYVGPVRIWSGIETEEPPVRRDDWPDLAAMAEAMLETRRRRFPDMVRSGRMAADAAAAEIATFEAIARDWLWILRGQGEPAGIETLPARAAALDRSLHTLLDLAREAGGFTADLADKAHLVIALRWHCEPANRPHALLQTGREMRAALPPPEPRKAA
ncbi:hypothetical protein [Novosphingobium colocasiae]|uniref:Uncharacterized protein n=1 Tax=Novosphingobium colocasiae TaxID=1256513 RepID=A0A918PEY6_9SPHN|nr:hypothetical protein [Novosphingobium colocasiae]GGZ02508.1 hypothetical protein GCM10011614_16970 [Novosphingobium colocasiae]